MWSVVSLAAGFLLLGAADQAAKPSAMQAPAEKPKAAAPALTPDEQVAAMEAQCAKSAAAQEKRQAEKPLFQRLGGEEKIHALVTEAVKLHLKNDAIKHFFAKSNTKTVVDHISKFFIAGTGGPAVYEGPDLATSHADMKLTNADFLAAGADVVQAMKNLGYGQNEIDEVVCTFVALRPQVVLPAGTKAASKHEHKPGDGHKH